MSDDPVMASTSLWLGLLGSLLLVAGVFTPVVQVPFMGQLDYFRDGRGDGVFVLAMGAISFLLVLLRQFRWLWVTSLTSMGVLIFSLLHFHQIMNETREGLERELIGNPFKGLAYLAVESISLQWGWGVLFGGVLMLIAAAALVTAPRADETRTPSLEGNKAEEEPPTGGPDGTLETIDPPYLGKKHADRELPAPSQWDPGAPPQSSGSSMPVLQPDIDQRLVQPSQDKRGFSGVGLILGGLAVAGMVILAIWWHRDGDVEWASQWIYELQGKVPGGTHETEAERPLPTVEVGPPALEPRDLVREIQKRLTELGYAPGPIDGQVGAKTIAAIRSFQKDNDVLQTGRPTMVLLKQLKEAKKTVSQ